MVQLRKHSYGFYQVIPQPSEKDLEAHYQDYYANPDRDDNQYSFGYTEDEIRHKQLAIRETRLFASSYPGRLLDIGCGEGFFLDGFGRLGWQVEGVDFTDDGVRKYFPELQDRLTIGNVFADLETRAARGATYDLIICNNVLEHVLDPVGLVAAMRNLLGKCWQG